MCGLAGGMSTTLVGNEIDIIRTLMVLATLRGVDGSGAIVIHPEKKKLRIGTCKSEFSAAELINDQNFLKLTQNQPKIIAAHARAPTKGGVTLPFIHPHRCGPVTGLHNGTMTKVMGEDIPKDKSDSKMIFEALEKVTPQEFVTGSSGAYSLVWVDVRDTSLNFLRNSQRPMWFAHIGSTNHTSTMYWSSERGMLEYALMRAGKKLSEVFFEQTGELAHIKFPLNTAMGLKPRSIEQLESPYAYKADQYDALDQWMSGETERKKNNATGQSVIPFRPTTSTASHGTTPSSLPKVEALLARRSGQTETFHPTGATARPKACCICDDTIGDKTCREINYGTQRTSQFICQPCIDAANPIATGILKAMQTH